MAAFYLDNDISDGLIHLLQAQQHDVVHTRQIGQARATDDQQLLTATQLGRILVTHNARDFILVHHAWRLWPATFGTAWPQHPGILVIPQPPEFPVARAADEIGRLIQAHGRTADELHRFEIPTGWRRQP